MYIYDLNRKVHSGGDPPQLMDGYAMEFFLVVVLFFFVRPYLDK